MAEITLEFNPRPQQEKILQFVQESIRSGKKFSMIDAPTGVGKSYAAIMIADWYRREINKRARVDIITNTKLLQDQYIRDFSFAANLKGKNNYWCKRQNMGCGDAQLLQTLLKAETGLFVWIAQHRHDHFFKKTTSPLD